MQTEPMNPTTHQSPAPEAIQALNQSVQQAATWIPPLRDQLGRVIVGQEELVDRLLASMLVNGHILLEGVPGLAKTLAHRNRLHR